MIALQVALTLLREILRALLTPLRLLGYLPFRHHWRKVARQVLTEVRTHTDAVDDLAAFLARQRTRHGPRPHLFLSAGETSGELHATRLVHALHDRKLRWSTFGGPTLHEATGQPPFPLSEHAVMGVRGVLRQLPLILRAYATFLRLLRDDPPDLVILVDYPGLHVVMAKAARRRGIPVLHYVAPQYWAWGPWRMRRYRRAVDATLTILPFETAFFHRFAVPARYIGHPLLDDLHLHPPDPAAVAAIAARPTLCLLPGSRRAEIEANLPGMLRVATALRDDSPSLRVVLPHRDPRRTPLLRELLSRCQATFVEHHEGPLAPFLAGSRLILAKSGTGSLEACLHGNPVIVVYRLRGLLATLGYHNILSVPWIAAANLIAGRAVVPEFCFAHDGGWDDVLAAARSLWADGPARTQAVADLREVRARLGEPGATARVAAIVRSFLDHTSSR
ncbi:MAG: lipid-A-disaccharide synthase [Planctomycetes bacterium]|nr:lipid-A-disaccharide synthase [Planctomycetota bacterium]